MRPGPLVAALALLGVGGLLASQTACSAACDTSGQDPVEYNDGIVKGTTYETTEPRGTWLDFPAGRRYRLMHHLGTSDVIVTTYLAFSSHPVPQDDASVGNSSPAAGNAIIIEDYQPDYVQVRNDTCAEYYLRVIISPVDPSAASDAGTD